MEASPVYLLAKFFALLCLVGIVPNLFWFNWPGIISAVACAAYAYYYPDSSVSALFFALVLCGFFFLRQMHREMSGRHYETFSLTEFVGNLIDRLRSMRQAPPPAPRKPAYRNTIRNGR